jgi:hypothetical protein
VGSFIDSLISLERVRHRCAISARSARPPTKPVHIIHRIYLFHIFGFGGDTDILRIPHFLCYIRVIRGCRHSRSRIPEGGAFKIRNAGRVINNDRIPGCVILDECVTDAVNIITCETHPVGGTIARSSHSERVSE